MHHVILKPTKFRMCMLILATLALGRITSASEGPPPVLNPAWHVSPSGEYRLHVNPSSLHGEGEGTYKLMNGDREVWAATHPFTLWEAQVTDDGIVAGYAYTNGWRGYPKVPGGPWNGNFHIVIFDATGAIRLNEVTPRDDSQFLHTPPNPLAYGMMVHQVADRFIVRLRDADVNRRLETWRVYELSTGKSLNSWQPQQAMANSEPVCWSLAAHPIEQTPLTIVQWWRYEYDTKSRVGARFDVLDGAGGTIWTLELPDDYSTGDDKTEDALQDEIRQSGAVLDSPGPRMFAIRHVAESKRVVYSVRREKADGDRWTIE